MSRHRISTHRLVAAAVAVVILARFDVAQSADPDPRPGPGPIIINPGPRLPGSGRVVDLAELPVATAILEVAADELEDVVLEGAIIDGQGFLINDCLGVRSTAGKFFLHMSRPEFYLGPEGLHFEFYIHRVSLTAVKLQTKPRLPTPRNPDPCDWGRVFEVGGSATDIRFSVHFEPKIDLELCDLLELGNLEVDLSIGGLNLKPLQNNLDDVVKKLIEASFKRTVNLLTPAIFGGAMRSGIAQVICNAGVHLYDAYMQVLSHDVDLHRLPEAYIEELQPHFPNRDLHDVRFGYSPRQPANNATTDCTRIYFNNSGYVERLRTASLSTSAEWDWLLHELRHTEQCAEVGGRTEYAEMWMGDLGLAALKTALTDPKHFFALLHDNMPMEEDASERAHTRVVVRGGLTDSRTGLTVAGRPILVVPAGEAPFSRERFRATTRDSAAYPWGTGYEVVLAGGAYDFYTQPLIDTGPIGGVLDRGLLDRGPIGGDDIDTGEVQWILVEAGVNLTADADGNGITDVVHLDLDSSTDPVLPPQNGPVFVRGDADRNGEVDISDALLTLVSLFVSGEELGCQKAADTNDDGLLDISDPLHSLGFLFLGTEPPPMPYPGAGEDGTEDDLSCEQSLVVTAEPALASH